MHTDISVIGICCNHAHIYSGMVLSIVPLWGCRESLSMNSTPIFWKILCQKFLPFYLSLCLSLYLSVISLACFFLPSQSILLLFFKQIFETIFCFMTCCLSLLTNSFLMTNSFNSRIMNKHPCAFFTISPRL